MDDVTTIAGLTALELEEPGRNGNPDDAVAEAEANELAVAEAATMAGQAGAPPVAEEASREDVEAERTRVLRERAIELARPLVKRERGESLSVLEFSRGRENYAIEMSAVGEVHAAREITPVPGTPPHVLGVIGVRGRICSVLDLARLFESPSDENHGLLMAVVLRSSTMEFALAADSVAGMRRVPAEELQSQVTTFSGIRKQYLRAVTQDRVAILDAERLLGDQNLVVRQASRTAQR
jgi:purine-binding chemotaxis protein CheW